MLLHQIWNQRRQNLWIFIELLIAGFFLWMVIDPIYVQTADRLIPQGGQTDGMYVVSLGQYDESFGGYDPVQDEDSLMVGHYRNIVRTVRTCPEVESLTVAAYMSFPNSSSWNGMQFYNADTLMMHTQQYRFVPLEGGDLPATYGMRDVRTGEILSLPPDFATRPQVAISARIARTLFGTTDAVGRMLYTDGNLTQAYEVCAVFDDYKHFTHNQPYPLVVMADNDGLRASTWMVYFYNIVFRLKDGIDPDAFEARFAREVAPHLSQGNFYFDSLDTFADYSRNKAASSGITNKLRLQYILGGFALLCIFLGMVGTFWIRANARREDVGIMRTLGSTRRGIVRHFLAEGWVLVTAAFVPALIVVANYVIAAGFSDGISSVSLSIFDRLVPDPAYAQNRPLAHFLWVTALTYASLLLTALTGTYIAVRRAARILPVEALRDE